MRPCFSPCTIKWNKHKFSSGKKNIRASELAKKFSTSFLDHPLIYGHIWMNTFLFGYIYVFIILSDNIFVAFNSHISLTVLTFTITICINFYNLGRIKSKYILLLKFSQIFRRCYGRNYAWFINKRKQI